MTASLVVVDVPVVAILASAADVHVLRDAVPQVNDVLFNRLGIIAPIIEVRPVTSPVPPAMQLNGADLGVIDTQAPALSIATILAAHADQLIVPTLVEFYLSRLQNRSPALVSAVRTRFSTTELVQLLRERVSRNESIRDFSGILDEALAHGSVS